MEIKDISREDDGEKQEVVITFVASPEEVADATEKFYADIANREIDGFRKGKAPREVLENSVGGKDKAAGGIAEVLINELALKALDDSDVIFLSEPAFNVTKAPVEGEPFTFTASGIVPPVMKLIDDDPVEIEMPPEDPTDAEIADQLKSIQDFYHSFENISDKDHKAEMGDYVNMTLTVTNDGKPVSGLNKAKRMVGLGNRDMPLSFDEKIVGSKAGDNLSFDFQFDVSEDDKEVFGDGNLHADVEIRGFRKCITPEIDDDLAQKVGCENKDDMIVQLKQQIGSQKAAALPKLKVDRTMDAAISKLDGEVPQYYIDFVRQDVAREFMQSLQAQGTNLQDWMIQNAVNGDAMKDEIAQEAYRRAAIDCLLEAVFAKENMQLTEEDIDAMFKNQEDPTLREQYEQAYRMGSIRKMARQNKASRWLVDNAKVTIVE